MTRASSRGWRRPVLCLRRSRSMANLRYPFGERRSLSRNRRNSLCKCGDSRETCARPTRRAVPKRITPRADRRRSRRSNGAALHQSRSPQAFRVIHAVVKIPSSASDMQRSRAKALAERIADRVDPRPTTRRSAKAESHPIAGPRALGRITEPRGQRRQGDRRRSPFR